MEAPLETKTHWPMEALQTKTHWPVETLQTKTADQDSLANGDACRPRLAGQWRPLQIKTHWSMETAADQDSLVNGDHAVQDSLANGDRCRSRSTGPGEDSSIHQAVWTVLVISKQHEEEDLCSHSTAFILL